MGSPRKLRLIQRQCPGDVLMVTAALKALHTSQPGAFITDYHGHHRELFDNNPFVTHLEPWEGQEVNLDYGYQINNCGRPRHFVEAFTEFLSGKLGVYIEQRDFRGDVYLGAGESEPWPGLPERYWILDAGRKADYTAKFWGSARFQQVVDALRGQVQFVQIGAAGDFHPAINGAINLVGQTSIRELIRILHRAAGVLTPVSFPMHLAAAVPVPQGAPERGCVVIAGHREPRHWEAYPGHAYLGASGRIRCAPFGAGCWHNKTVKIDGDANLCQWPVQEGEEWLPECLRRVSVDEVVAAVLSFETNA